MGAKPRMTAKQKAFCQEYLIDLNATQAAIRAGYSKRRASEIGYQLLQKTTVGAEIERLLAKRAKRTEITADKVLEELAKIGFADIKDFLEYRTEKTVVGQEDGELVTDYQYVIDLKNSDNIDGKVVNEVKLDNKGTFTFKLHDKLRALEKLGQHLGLFVEKGVLELTGKDGGPIQHKYQSMTDEELLKEAEKHGINIKP